MDAPDSAEDRSFPVTVSEWSSNGRLSSNDACCKASGLPHLLKGTGGRNPI